MREKDNVREWKERKRINKRTEEELMQSDKHFFCLCAQWQESTLFASALNNKQES